MAMQQLNEVLAEAMREFEEKGFYSAERLAYWQRRIKDAAEAAMVPEAVMDRLLRDALQATFDKLIGKGRILIDHPGVERFTLETLKPHLHAELNRRILASADLIRLNREQAITHTLQRFSGWATSIPVGGSDAVEMRDEKEKIRKSVAGLPYRERRVAIDQGAKLNSSISEVIALDNGALAGVWYSHWREPGYDYREDHKERDGHLYVVPDNWALKQGFMKLDGHPYTNDITRPAEEPFCFPGDSRVPFADGVEVAYRRWYSGELSEIVTASGKTLRGTPNHPVFTTRGWVALGLLNEGDDVIELGGEAAQLFEQNKDHAVPTFAQIFGAVSERGITKMSRGKMEQFHGDGTTSDVDIVDAARPLTFDHVTAPDQLFSQLRFAMSVLRRTTASALQFLTDGSLLARAGSMGLFGQTPSSLFAFAAHSDGIGRAAVAQFDAMPFQPQRERGARYADIDGKRQDAFPFAIAASRIVKVKRLSYSGHVFNLQTRDGWYVTEGIITHNCRCKYRWVYHLRQLPEAMLTAKGRAALLNVRVAV